MFYKKIFTYEEIDQANKNKDNMVDGISEDDRLKIASLVCDRKEKDLKSMEEWLKTVEEGLKIMRLKYVAKIKPIEESYNSQHPLLLNAVTSTASRLFTEVHRDMYLPNPRIIGNDPDNIKQDRVNRVKHYIQAVAVDFPHSSWLENQERAYPRLVLMGTQIKQVRLDSLSTTFDNEFIPHNDIIIHNKSRSLEKAPAITKRVYLSQNEIVERINQGFYTEYDYIPELDGDECLPFSPASLIETDENGDDLPYDQTYCILEQHTWLDLDGDGYQEPYIVTVDEDNNRLLRLVPRIDDITSSVELTDKNKLKPIKLNAECYFADLHFMPDPEGNFWSMGLAHMIGSINALINELLNNMLNVAITATKQGGILAAGVKNLSGKQKMDVTKWNVAAGVNGDDIRKALVPFDIKDPSPVVRELTTMLIQTGEKMGMLSEALSGEMPTREMPAQTMLMLVEQSLKNAQAVYRRIHKGLTKEFQIMCRMLVQNGNEEHYKMVIGDPEASIFDDLDMSSMDLSYTTDSSTSSAAERIIKYNILLDMAKDSQVGSYINSQELITRMCKALDEPDPEKLIVEPPPPQPDPMTVVAEKQIEADAQDKAERNRNRRHELEIKAYEAVAKVENDRADSAHKLTNVTPIALSEEERLYGESLATAVTEPPVEAVPPQLQEEQPPGTGEQQPPIEGLGDGLQ